MQEKSWTPEDVARAFEELRLQGIAASITVLAAK